MQMKIWALWKVYAQKNRTDKKTNKEVLNQLKLRKEIVKNEEPDC